MPGAMAARLVWLLRMHGIDAALLDGGLGAWPGELTTDAPVPSPAEFTPRPWPDEALATIDEAANGPAVIDARAGERFRGETEPLDPRAGHIPGAQSFPLGGNLAEDGRFRTPEELRERFEDLGPDVISSRVRHPASPAASSARTRWQPQRTVVPGLVVAVQRDRPPRRHRGVSGCATRLRTHC